MVGGLADEAAKLAPWRRHHSESSGTFLTGMAFKRETSVCRRVDGSDRGEGTGQGNTARLPRAGYRGSRPARLLRRRPELRCTNTISWRTPTTPLPIENDPRAVFERMFGASGSTDRAARLARMKRDRSILDLRGRVTQRGSEDHRAAGQGQDRRILRLRSRHRATHPDGRRSEYPRAPGRRSADWDSERLCRARQADDGPAGAGVSDRSDPHQHVHAGAKRSAIAPIRRSASPIRITRCRITRTTPQARAAGTRSTSTTSSSLPIWSRSWPRRPKATARCWITRCSSTAPASATATPISTTTCRSPWSVEKQPGSRAAATSAIRSDAADEPARRDSGEAGGPGR